MNFILRLFICIMLLGCTFCLSRAQLNSPMMHDISLAIEKDMNVTNSFFFSSWKPYLQNQISQASSLSLPWNGPTYKGMPWWKRKLFKESLLVREDSTYLLFFDPLFDFELGRESGTDRKLYTNTRGIRAGARLGKHFAFETELYENQAILPRQVDQFTSFWKVVPGQASARRFKGTGWDYFAASGYISWSPMRTHNIQFGMGKNFAGDGYRSLLLSDNAFYYPYLKYTFTLGRWQYTRTLASLMDHITYGKGSEYKKKTAGFNYLSVCITPKIQLSLFEANIWHNPDSTGKFKIEGGLINPVILTNTFFTGSKTNVHSLVGLNIKYLATRKLVLYGQLMLDDIMNTTQKFGLQGGIKYFDVFGINGWFLQMEYNQVESGTYSFSNNSFISYTHFNQNIAHPLGNNFREMIALSSYAYKRWKLAYRFNLAKEKDTGAFPSKEFAVYSNGKQVVINHIQLSYVFNPRTMMQLTAGYTDRNEDPGLTSRSNNGIFFIAFRTPLRNIYYDF